MLEKEIQAAVPRSQQEKYFTSPEESALTSQRVSTLSLDNQNTVQTGQISGG
jgi:hypothetical protein